MATFGKQIKSEAFFFDADAIHFNHGSYGALPRTVYTKQMSLREEIEKHPDSYFRRNMPALYRSSLDELCKFVNCRVEDTVFVENTTQGQNCVLQSLDWITGDKMLLSNLNYHSTKKLAEVMKEQKGIDTIYLDIKFPVRNKREILQYYRNILEKKANIKLAIVDHITSPSSVLMPITDIVSLCHEFGVMVLIDGAHAWGQIQLDVQSYGADFYISNGHKWGFTPRGCAFLWVNPKHMGLVKPVEVSHFHGVKFHYDFCVRGTRDNTPYMCVPQAIEFHASLGGFDGITRYVSNLLDTNISKVEKNLGTKRLDIAPEFTTPFMRLVRVPVMPNYEKTSVGGSDLETDLFKRYNIQVLCMPIQGELYLRLSAHVYNDEEDFDKLVAALQELMQEPKTAKPTKGYDLPIMHWDLSPLSDL